MPRENVGKQEDNRDIMDKVGDYFLPILAAGAAVGPGRKLIKNWRRKFRPGKIEPGKAYPADHFPDEILDDAEKTFIDKHGREPNYSHHQDQKEIFDIANRKK